MVGGFPHWEYQQRSVSLAPGAVLALFTDGVTEAARWKNPLDGSEMSALLQEHAGAPADAIGSPKAKSAAAQTTARAAPKIEAKPTAKVDAEALPPRFEFGAADWDMAVPYWEAGFVLMVPMLRGENGQPGTFSFLYDEVDDVLAAAAYLAQQPGVDSTQIFLAGHSAGGTLTLLAIEASGRFRAASSSPLKARASLSPHASAYEKFSDERTRDAGSPILIF